MKVGDYVRTKSYGINKISGFFSTLEEDFIDCDDDKYQRVLINKKDIIKSSPDIIDLIEVGDYVNGLKVDKKWEDRVVINTRDEIIVWFEYQIKSIVTKEQFESMEYKINKENN